MKKSEVAGFINCKRQNKRYDIHIDARPTDKGDFLCPCGKWIRSDPYYHQCIYKGKEMI